MPGESISIKRLTAAWPPKSRACWKAKTAPYCCKGAPLIGTKIQYGITNAIWYTVTDVADELHLCSERGEQICLSYEKAAKVLTLRHAMTVHKSQSRTLDGHVHICPGNKPGHVSPYWSLKHLLVAASRARSLTNLSIE